MRNEGLLSLSLSWSSLGVRVALRGEDLNKDQGDNDHIMIIIALKHLKKLHFFWILVPFFVGIQILKTHPENTDDLTDVSIIPLLSMLWQNWFSVGCVDNDSFKKLNYNP